MGVDGQQNGADFCGGELERDPVRHVGGPDGNLFTLLNSKGHESFGKLVHEIAELAVGEPVVPVIINDCVVVRIFFYGSVKYLSQCKGLENWVFHSLKILFSIPEDKGLHKFQPWNHGN